MLGPKPIVASPTKNNMIGSQSPSPLISAPAKDQQSPIVREQKEETLALSLEVQQGELDPEILKDVCEAMDLDSGEDVLSDLD